MSNRCVSSDFKWAGGYMNLKLRIFCGSSLGVININVVFRDMGMGETTKEGLKERRETAKDKVWVTPIFRVQVEDTKKEYPDS